MKMTKRLLLIAVCFLVLSSLLAVGVAASQESYKDYIVDYTCSCFPEKNGLFDNYIASYGSSASAYSFALHDTAQCSASYAYVSGSIWHYPAAQPTYNRTTRTDSESANDGSADASIFVVEGSNGIGEVFCVESDHTVRVTCNGVQRTYSKYICNGEPAMK